MVQQTISNLVPKLFLELIYNTEQVTPLKRADAKLEVTLKKVK
jgi:hypothetical protein